jgi:hypothetical protein
LGLQAFSVEKLLIACWSSFSQRKAVKKMRKNRFSAELFAGGNEFQRSCSNRKRAHH